MDTETVPNPESLTHAPATAGKAKKRRRGPTLRPVNVTKRQQDAEHQAKLACAEDRRQKQIASAPSPAIRRLVEMGELTDAAGREIAPPNRLIGSEQSVMVLRRVTVADTIHPDDWDAFDPSELAKVTDDDSEVASLSPEYYRHVDRIPNSIHRHLLAYQSESQEKAMATHEAKIAKKIAKDRRRAARAGHKVETDAVVVDEQDKAEARRRAEEFAGKARELAAENADRWRYGFYYPGGNRRIAGDIVEAFHEYLGENVLRSHLSPSLARFAQIVPKCGRVRAGYDKAALFNTPSKLIALDCPYVELDQTRLCCITVEFDTVWASAAAFRQALLTRLPPHMLPQLMVGRMTRSGLFARPHCIWFLNPNVILPDGTTRDASVWNEPYREDTDRETGEVRTYGDKRCRKAPIKHFHAVQRGLVAHLLPLGADPGCWNIGKPKNPLSPFWSTLVCNEDFWPELADFTKIRGFSPKVDEADLAKRGAMMRAEAAGKTGEISTPSNLAWSTIGQVIEPMVSKHLRIRDLSFIDAAYKGAETLSRWFDDRVRPRVEDELKACPSRDRLLEGRCRFAANYCMRMLAKSAGRNAYQKGRKDPVDGEEPKNPKRVRRRPVNRGRDDSLKVKTLTDAEGGERRLTKQELQKANGERSGATRTAVALWRMCQMLHVNGITVDAMRSASRSRKAEIIKGLVGMVSESFAYDRWNDAIEALAADAASGNSAKVHKDKKHSPSPALTIDPSLPVTAKTTAFDPETRSNLIEPPWIGPADVPPEAGSLDHRRSNRASGPGSVLRDAVGCVSAEPVES